MINPDTGQDIPIPRSTRGLKKEAFNDYMNKINEYAHDNQITLPTPDDKDNQ